MSWQAASVIIYEVSQLPNAFPTNIKQIQFYWWDGGRKDYQQLHEEAAVGATSARLKSSETTRLIASRADRTIHCQAASGAVA
jgi:hypothetical protein